MDYYTIAIIFMAAACLLLIVLIMAVSMAAKRADREADEIFERMRNLQGHVQRSREADDV